MPYPAPWDRSFISVFSILLLEASYSVPNLLNKSKKDHNKFAYGQKKLNDLSEKVDSFIKNVQVVFIDPVFGSLIGFPKPQQGTACPCLLPPLAVKSKPPAVRVIVDSGL